MNPIIPTIFSHNKKEFKEDFANIINVSKNIQTDFMDGKFVKANSIALKDIPSLRRYNKNFEAHLMVSNPEKWISSCKNKGFKKILFHYEAFNNSSKAINLLKKIKSERLTAGIVFNPKTSFNKILEVKDEADVIMFMGHTPGVEGIPLNQKVLAKIKNLRKLDKKIQIEVDGSVTDKTLPRLVKAGANLLSVGSFISSSKNPKQTFNKLNKLFKESI